MAQRSHARSGMPQNVLSLDEARAAAARRHMRSPTAHRPANADRRQSMRRAATVRRALLLGSLAAAVGLGIVIGLLLH